MTVETLIGNLSRTEQLLAMELIWRALSSVESTAVLSCPMKPEKIEAELSER